MTPPYTTHDELVAAIAAFATTLERARFVDAFVASLSTRELGWRSALGHYAILQNFTAHAHTRYHASRQDCGVCGLEPTLDEPIDEGFVDAPYYPATLAASELYLLRDATPPSSTDADRAILADILDAIRALPPQAGLSQLERSLMGKLKSNKYQRIDLLEVLGFLGILCPIGAHDYTDAFVPFSESAWVYPPGSRSDWRYPARMWRGTEGIVEARVQLYFSEYL